MKWFPTRLFIVCLCIGAASGHIVCEYQRISLGIAKTSAECQSKCIELDANDLESTRDCIAWGHSLKDEKCSGWILEDDPEEYSYFYGVGSYNDYSYVEYETCALAPHTNITTTHTKGANKKTGCFFELKNLGYSETPEDCQTLCEGLISNRHGGCIAWSHSKDEEECQGLLSMPTNNFTSCGRA